MLKIYIYSPYGGYIVTYSPRTRAICRSPGAICRSAGAICRSAGAICRACVYAETAEYM